MGSSSQISSSSPPLLLLGDWRGQRKGRNGGVNFEDS